MELARAAARDRARPRAGGCSTTRWRRELAGEPALTLLCGRYEGFDERIVEHFCTDEISIGRYVLAGGELAAMVVCDAVLRKLPGALGHADSALEESFSPALDGRPRVPALHAARRSGAGGTFRRCCCRAITSGSGSGGWSRAGGARRADGALIWGRRRFATIRPRSATPTLARGLFSP